MSAVRMLTASRKPACSILQAEYEPERIPGILSINGKRYAYRTISRSTTSMTCTHVRLFQQDGFTGSTYDCVLFRDGREDCDCADFTYRSGEAGRRCKHLQALADLGVLGNPPVFAE